MASFSVVILPHQRRSDGSCNVKIRIIHRRKVRYLATPWYARAEDMNRKHELRNRRMRDNAEALADRYRDLFERLGPSTQYMTADEVVAALREAKAPECFRLDFVDYMRSYAGRLDGEGRSRAHVFRSIAKSIEAYCEGRHPDINDITPALLRGWTEWLYTREIHRGNGSRNYVADYFTMARSVYRRAMREFNTDEQHPVITSMPFGHVDAPRRTASRKRALTVEEIRAIAALPDQPAKHGWNRVNVARDLFILSLMLVGMNAVDLRNVTDYRDGRITYERSKTKERRDDRALISIAVPPEAMPLMERYRDPTGERVFDFHRRWTAQTGMNLMLSKGMRRIGEMLGIEGLQFYAARHSWATIAANEAGVDIYTVHESLNHRPRDMRVTYCYIKPDFRKVDEANRRVLDLLQIRVPGCKG